MALGPLKHLLEKFLWDHVQNCPEKSLKFVGNFFVGSCTDLLWDLSNVYWKRLCRISGPGSVVGIATGCGLDGPGIESRWGRDFPHLSRPALGPTQPPVQWVPDLSRSKERPGRDADPSPPSSAVVKKR